MKKIHMLLVSVALATMTIIIGWANNAYAYGSGYTSRGAEFEISGKHITNVKYFTAGQVVSLSGLYRADRKAKGVMQVEIQHRRNEKYRWTTVDKLDVAYDNEVHEPILTNGRKPRGIRHEHEIDIANSGEYRLKYCNGDSDLTVYCTDIRFE